MADLKIGDIVARKSYGCDIFFKVAEINNSDKGNIVRLQGISYRIEADAPEWDLELMPENKIQEYRDKCRKIAENKSGVWRGQKVWGLQKKAYYRNTPKDEAGKILRPGKILHLDGDKDYLETCIDEYRKEGLDVNGYYVPEKDQPGNVTKLLEEHRPDVLVLTGHDGFIKGEDSYNNINSYRNSKYFVEAVKAARKFGPDLDNLVIFAGACQSMYMEIIKAGANFASAPFRDLIHTLDPVRVCSKIAFTGIDKVLTAEEVIENTITGITGIGGIQTRGKLREGFPAEPY
jgi:spore coat assembly protein